MAGNLLEFHRVTVVLKYGNQGGTANNIFVPEIAVSSLRDFLFPSSNKFHLLKGKT